MARLSSCCVVGAAAVLMGALLSACQSGGSGTPSAGGSPASSTSSAASPSVADLPGGCSDSAPCTFNAGTYSLAANSVLPRMTLTLPAGWSSTENNAGELNLVPPGQPDDRLFVWTDMVAVKSTGPGHGTTVLKVDSKPESLIGWLTSNPDFTIVAKPAATTFAGNPMQTLTLVVSRSARYGDPGCPANPRCADLFTKPGLWGTNFYGIGGDSEDTLSLGTIRTTSGTQTLIVNLEALNHADAAKLAAAARPILDSVQLPTG
jgi:hypothetical protein